MLWRLWFLTFLGASFIPATTPSTAITSNSTFIPTTTPSTSNSTFIPTTTPSTAITSNSTFIPTTTPSTSNSTFIPATTPSTAITSNSTDIAFTASSQTQFQMTPWMYRTQVRSRSPVPSTGTASSTIQLLPTQQRTMSQNLTAVQRHTASTGTAPESTSPSLAFTILQSTAPATRTASVSHSFPAPSRTIQRSSFRFISREWSATSAAVTDTEGVIIVDSSTIPTLQITPTPTISVPTPSSRTTPAADFQSEVYIIAFEISESQVTQMSTYDLRSQLHSVLMNITSPLHNSASVSDVVVYKRTSMDIKFKFKISAINVDQVFMSLQDAQHLIYLTANGSQVAASFLAPLTEVIPEHHPPNDKIWGIFEWPQLLSIGFGLTIILVLSVLVVLVCRHSQKKKRERKRKNLQQELNTVTGLSRNPSRRAGEWPDWNLVQQQKDDVWVPIQPERERSPYRQFSLYVEENLALQEDMKPSQPAKQKASQPAKRKPSNHKAQRQGSKKRDEDHRDDLYAKPHKQSSSYLQPPEDSTGPGWPWKPIGGLATRNKLSDSSLNSAAVATDPEEMMKLWHEDGWYQLRDLHT